MPITQKSQKNTNRIRVTNKTIEDNLVEDMATVIQAINDIPEPVIPTEEYTYREVVIGFNQIRNIDANPVFLLPNALIAGGGYFDFYGVLEFTAGAVPYDEGHLRLGSDNQVVIEKTFLSGLFNKTVQFSRDSWYADTVNVDLVTRNTLTANSVQSPLALYSADYFGNVGDGTILAKIWYKIKQFGTEL